jgi:hypothetical protein
MALWEIGRIFFWRSKMATKKKFQYLSNASLRIRISPGKKG